MFSADRLDPDPAPRSSRFTRKSPGGHTILQDRAWKSRVRLLERMANISVQSALDSSYDGTIHDKRRWQLVGVKIGSAEKNGNEKLSLDK